MVARPKLEVLYCFPFFVTKKVVNLSGIFEAFGIVNDRCFYGVMVSERLHGV